MYVHKLRDRFRFFQNLELQDIEKFLSFCEPAQIDAGKYLWVEGGTDNFAAFILNGRVGIKKQTEFGDRHVIVGLYAPGSVVGELCLLTNNPRSVSAEIIEPAELVLLHSQKFEEMLSRFPNLGLALLRHMFIATSNRLTKSYERFASIF